MTPQQSKCLGVLDGPPPTPNVYVCRAPGLEALNACCEMWNDKGPVLFATAGDRLRDGEAAKGRRDVLLDIALLVPTKNFHQTTHN
jgi:hypothetical protein